MRVPRRIAMATGIAALIVAASVFTAKTTAQTPRESSRSRTYALHPVYEDPGLALRGTVLLPEGAPAVWEPLLKTVVAGSLGYGLNVRVDSENLNLNDSVRMSGKTQPGGKLAVPIEFRKLRLDDCFQGTETRHEDLQTVVWYPPTELPKGRQLECLLALTDRILSHEVADTEPQFWGPWGAETGVVSWGTRAWAFDDAGVHHAVPLHTVIRGQTIVDETWHTPLGPGVAIFGEVDSDVPAWRVFKPGPDTTASMFELQEVPTGRRQKAGVVIAVGDAVQKSWGRPLELVLSHRNGEPVLVSDAVNPRRQLEASEDSLLIRLVIDDKLAQPTVELHANGWQLEAVKGALEGSTRNLGGIAVVDSTDLDAPLKNGRTAVVRLPKAKGATQLVRVLSVAWALLKRRPAPELSWVGTDHGDEGILEWGGAIGWAFHDGRGFRANPVQGAFGVHPGATIDAEPQGDWRQGEDRIIVAAGKVRRAHRAWRIHTRDSLEDDGLVRLDGVLGTSVVDLRYSTVDNFLGEAVYPPSATCYLTPGSAAALLEANAAIQARGLGFIIYDCYRPLSVQARMFELVPIPGFVAKPQGRGSSHNRATAIDLGLVDAQGRRLLMPTEHDSFSEMAASSASQGIPVEALANRQLLRETMAAAGFKGIRSEWWHFNGPDAGKGRPLDLDFPTQ